MNTVIYNYLLRYSISSFNQYTEAPFLLHFLSFFNGRVNGDTIFGFLAVLFNDNITYLVGIFSTFVHIVDIFK